MNAIIVAAGLGRRLMPITKNYPKCLLKINGKRIIDLTIEVLKECGIQEIIMVVGYQQEKIKDYLGKQVKYIINPIYDRTNTMYSLLLAQDYFDTEFLFLHSDIIFEKSILERILSHGCEICLAVIEKVVDDEDMKVRIENGLIRNIKKSIPLEEASGEFIGIAKFRGDGINYLKEALNKLVKEKNNYNAYFECAIEYLIKQGYKVYPSLTKNKFYVEIDTEENLKNLRKELSAKEGIL